MNNFVIFFDISIDSCNLHVTGLNLFILSSSASITCVYVGVHLRIGSGCQKDLIEFHFYVKFGIRQIPPTLLFRIHEFKSSFYRKKKKKKFESSLYFSVQSNGKFILMNFKLPHT